MVNQCMDFTFDFFAKENNFRLFILNHVCAHVTPRVHCVHSSTRRRLLSVQIFAMICVVSLSRLVTSYHYIYSNQVRVLWNPLVSHVRSSTITGSVKHIKMELCSTQLLGVITSDVGDCNSTIDYDSCTRSITSSHMNAEFKKLKCRLRILKVKALKGKV